MTPERRRELLAASRLGLTVLGRPAHFTYDRDQPREPNGRFGSGGGSPGGPDGGEFKPSADGKHGVDLPKNPKRLNIAEAHTALKEMGYKVGGERYDLKAKTSLIDLAHPDGTTSTVTGDQVKSIVYGGRRAAGAAPGKPESVEDLRRRLKEAEAKVAAASTKVGAAKAKGKGKEQAAPPPPAKPAKPAKAAKPVKAAPAATPKAAPKAAKLPKPPRAAAKPPKAAKPAHDHAATAARLKAVIGTAGDAIRKGNGKVGADSGPGDYDEAATHKAFDDARAAVKSKKDLADLVIHLRGAAGDARMERYFRRQTGKELDRMFTEATRGRLGSAMRAMI